MHALDTVYNTSLTAEQTHAFRNSVSQSPVFQAWLNEKFSPELLENKSELVECVMEQITHMVWICV